MMRNRSSAQESLAQLKELIGGTKEDLEDQLAQLQQRIETAETSIRAALQDDQARLQTCLNNLAQALEIANNIIRPDISIENNRAGQGSRTIFGTDTSQPQFDLTVSGNQAEQDAVMGSGVYTPQTLQVLLRDSGRGDVAFSLQKLQTQARATDVSVLQSMADQLTAERSVMTIESNDTNTAQSFNPFPVAHQHEERGPALNPGINDQMI